MRYSLLAIVTVAMIALSGCGDDDGSSASSGGSAASSGAPIAPPADGVIGRWKDTSNPLFSSELVILAEGGKLYLEQRFGDGSSMRKAIVEIESPLGRRFNLVQNNRLQDHWVIDANGDLLLRDTHGTAATAKKIE